MSPRFSSVAVATPSEVRPDRRSAAAPGLRLLPGGSPEVRMQAPGPHGWRRRPVPTPLLPVALPIAYRGRYLRRLLAPRRPVERALLSVIQETYLAGSSTRTVDALAETVGVPGTDPALVDAQGRNWDRRVDAFVNRRLQETCPYLMLVETPALVREAGEARTCRIVVAVAVAESGNRDVVGVAIRPADALTTFWQTFLGDLNERGLRGLRLVTADRMKGLLPALAAVFPGVRWQRCHESFIAEALATVPRDGRAAVEARLRAAFAEPDAASAVQALARVRGQFEFAYPELAAALELPVAALLSCYQAAPAQRRLVSSLKGLVSLQRELRQTCQLVGIFPHRQALRRLAGTIVQEISDEWAARPQRLGRRVTVAAAWAAAA
jgi:putative transposase